MIILQGGKPVIIDGKVAYDVNLCDCTCDECGCVNEPSGSLTLTFSSTECPEVDGHTIVVPRSGDRWYYNYVDDGVDPVFQDIVITIICKTSGCAASGPEMYALSLVSGCMPQGYFERCADATSTCSPFALDWAGLNSGGGSECFDCVDPGEDFDYDIQATPTP